jgi:RNA polymerase sigma-70 factor (ECF subfamily)
MAMAEVRRPTFDDLYEASRARLAGQVFALTGDWAGACDVVQEAFLRSWMRWDRIGRYDDPEAWVRRVAFNLAKNGWRRRDVPTATPPEAGRDDPDRSGHAELVAALLTLGPDERTAIALHYLADLPVAGVAAELGVPEGTVKSWLSRGRARLLPLLRPREDVLPDA